MANERFGFFSADNPIGLANCLNNKKEESCPADSPTETVPADSPAYAAVMIAEANAPSGAAASGPRAQRHPRAASRPRYRGGRQSCSPLYSCARRPSRDG
eukprot:4118275-Pyramimonas_sp.AAC.1